MEGPVPPNPCGHSLKHRGRNDKRMSGKDDYRNGKGTPDRNGFWTKLKREIHIAHTSKK